MVAADFPMQLQRLRKRRGISCQVLSELCGMNRNMISLYERGTCAPGLDRLIVLADFFQVSLDELCGRKFPDNHEK